ncbi:MAG: LruC domain-containing protein [Bacteroidales bacterium]|nr:LruC domain-containing protein [Bacteroidales bacterium]
MKHNIFLSATCLLIMAVTSCVTYQPNKEDQKENPEDLDLNFAFETRTTKTISITAINEVGKAVEGALFSVFTDNPYDDAGNRLKNPAPIYQGYTEAGGKLSIPMEVPNSTEEIYIVPELAGYGSMLSFPSDKIDDVLSLEFKGLQATQTKGMSAKSTIAPRESIKKGNNYNFFTYYKDSEYSPSDGTLQSSELVSFEELSTPFKTMVNDWFPEGGANYATDSGDSDLHIVEDGTQVWVTYIGDGGFSNGIGNANVWNSLYFYTYTDATKPAGTFFAPDNLAKTDAIHLTNVFPNLHPNKTVTGTKVQLLYWNGSQYVSEFPAGTYVGFMFVNFGFKKKTGEIGFTMQPGYDRSSTAALNSDKVSHGIFHWSEQFMCFVLGMENNNTKDADFNDALVRISTSKYAKLDREYPTPDAVAPKSSYSGTLAFEDTWPDKGDYDMNDFVTDYTYTFIKNTGTNNIAAVELAFQPKAVGASRNNGFGVQIPILVTNVASVTGSSLEGGQTLATVIIFDDVRIPFGGRQGFINTVKGEPRVPAAIATITITFNTPLDERDLSFKGVNPFLFTTDNRSNEIHLVDYPPTLKANMKAFGTQYDKSVPSNGVYYRMDNTFPWAVDLASSQSSLWRYPIEKISINNTYTKFGEWINNPRSVWYNAKILENIVKDNIYDIEDL